MKTRRVWHSSVATQIRNMTGATTPEQGISRLVERKLSQLGQSSPPVKLPILASLCGIKKIAQTEMQQDGRLVYAPDEVIIQVNSAQNEKRQRFSAAHEITHKIIDDAINQSGCDRQCAEIGRYIEKAEEEWLCDYGASRIVYLTPEYLKPIIAELGHTHQAILEIEQRHEVSFEAAARSFVESSDSPVAVVYYAMGFRKEELKYFAMKPLLPELDNKPTAKLRISRCYQSSSFPVYLPLNKSVPETSCIGQAYQFGIIVFGDEVFEVGKRSFQASVEAIPYTFYTRGQPTQGVIAILTGSIRLN